MKDCLVYIRNESPFPLPALATPGSAGFDLQAVLEQEQVVVAPLQRVLVGTGIYLALPDGFEAQVRPRSGLALRDGITCLNTPGTIDADYRGEIKVLLVNVSDTPATISHGQRIAQIVFCALPAVRFCPVDALPNATSRNERGFGHSGE